MEEGMESYYSNGVDDDNDGQPEVEEVD